MVKMLKTSTLLILLSFLSINVFSQGVVKGKILSSSEGQYPLFGAAVVEQGTTNGTTANFDGDFSLNVSKSNVTLKFSYIGYVTMKKTVFIPANGVLDLGTITLKQDAISLEDVVVVGRGVIDVARDRETPVAVSTIKIDKIQLKSGNQEFPEVMKNTPSVYVGAQASGYGDSRINIRGFSQENIALLFNGQPVNGMEDGKVYWSNWQGLSDIASAVQIQRGLGSSKLAISSVGATINVVTKATDKKQGGRVSALYGNDNYMKYVVSYSTGMNEKGWGMSFLLSHWQGDGYNDGTQGQGQTYFFSVGYKPSKNHAFNLSITGAPQWHNQNFQKKISDYQKYGFKYNNNWGYKNGEVYSWRKNFYHKPVANLNWDWKLSDKSSLSTVIYASVGQGGRTGSYGKRTQAYIYDENGQIDFDTIVNNNMSIAKDSTANMIVGKYGTGAIRSASINMHNWYGAVTNYSHQVNENLEFNLGADLRTYYGEHFKLVDDLLGLDGYWDNNYNGPGFQLLFPGGQLYTREHHSSPYMFFNNRNLHTNDKLDYYNAERISYGGLFGQLEYKTDRLSTFFQGALSNQWYQRFDYHSYALPSEQDSKKLQHLGYNLKGGANYNINEMHNVFANIGYYSRQPFHDDLFLNYRNDINDKVGNEKVLGLELGYGLRTDYIDVDLNGYSTTWSDRQIRQGVKFADNSTGVAYYENVTEVHNGLELEFKSNPIENLRVGGFASFGIWEYKGNINTTVYDENQNKIGESKLFLDGVKVGNSAQASFGFLADYKIIRGLSIDADWRYYDNLYASIDPSSFVTEDHKGSLKLPAFNLLDAGVSYKCYLENNTSLNFRFNVNNILDARYISESRTNIHEDGNTEVWNGINVNNQVYFGNGRTWNVSLAYRF